MSAMGKRVKSLLSNQKYGVLAVIDRDSGISYGAYVNYACDARGYPVMLISSLARHTQALSANPAASLLVADLPQSGDILTGQRACFMGRWHKIEYSDQMTVAYLAQHPYAQGYIGFADFSFWQLLPELIHTVAGFVQISTLPAAEVFED